MWHHRSQRLRDVFGPGCQLAACLALAAVLAPASASAAPFDCAHHHCGIAIDGEYPNLVVGTIDGIATPRQAQNIYRQAREQGLWKFLPPGRAAFARHIQVLSIRIPPGQSITVMESRAEMDTSGVTKGDLVRFSPHRGAYRAPHPGNPYWFTFGCVAVLCGRADHGCRHGYRPGIYRTSDGAELDASGRHVVPGGAVINVTSMRVETRGD